MSSSNVELHLFADMWLTVKSGGVTNLCCDRILAVNAVKFCFNTRWRRLRVGSSNVIVTLLELI